MLSSVVGPTAAHSAARPRTRRMLRVVAVLSLLAPVAKPQVQTAPRVIDHDKTLNAGINVKRESDFGRAMGTGRFGNAFDAEDDVVVAATNEFFGGMSGVGAGYPFENQPLTIPADLLQLEPPLPYEEGLGLGALDVEIGNVRGIGATNLIFVAAAHHDEGPEPLTNVGAVMVYDRTSLSGALVLKLLPPADGPLSTTLLFGHTAALADVDGDGYLDLIVGAAFTTEDLDGVAGGLQAAHGRVFIFFGHPDFLDPHYPMESDPPGYLHRWMALQAPQASAGARFVIGGAFGYSVAARDLDDDGMAEVLVGRPERGENGEVGEGRAHLFRGAWLASEAPSAGGGNEVATPDLTPDIKLGVATQYETLYDRTANFSRIVGFGFNVFLPSKDLGKPYSAAPIGDGFDGLLDVVIFSLSADYLAPDPADNVAAAGAAIVFFNDSTSTPGSLVQNGEEAGVKLHTPFLGGVNPSGPQTAARFGFDIETVSWPSLQGVIGTYLLIGEPEAPSATGIARAGRAFMLELPIKEFTSGGGNHPNALPTQIIDPTGVQLDSKFGAGIVVGDYVIDPLYPGEEFVVSARGKDVVNPQSGMLKEKAGQAYSFRAKVP